MNPDDLAHIRQRADEPDLRKGVMTAFDQTLLDLYNVLDHVDWITMQNDVLDAKLTAVRELHQRATLWDPPIRMPHCGGCHFPYPCETIQALEGEPQ